MNPIVQSILSNQKNPVMCQMRENLLANKMHDESATQAYDRLQRTGNIDRLLAYGSIVQRPADSATNAAAFMEMPE